MADSIPQHIGYIIDGNRRWAKKHGLPTYEGHLAGYNAIQEVARASFEAGVKYVSVYSFSTENWKRNKDEIKKIMNLVLRFLKSDLHIIHENNIRLIVLGTRDHLDAKIIKAIEEAEETTRNNTRGTLALCFNYGGQLEIADAVKKIVQSGVSADQVTPELIAKNLYAPEVPPVDLIVRTSGEQRISNFMLWRASYSEFMFIDKYFPDMTKDDVTAIIKEYTRRDRRIGG
jgi:undecaprenyl diphosphate synthase